MTRRWPGDAFFEEGIHWLHLAASLGPAITEVHGFRPSVSPDGPDRRAKSMMVAFKAITRRLGPLLFARDSVAPPRHQVVEAVRPSIITFESNGLFVLVRGTGWPRLMFPGFRDIRGYKAMYRDFVAAIRNGRPRDRS